MASAVNGSLDGVLMSASLRVMALRRIDSAEIRGLLPATICSVREPKARIDTVRPSFIRLSTHPSRWAMPMVLSAISTAFVRLNRCGSDS